MQWVKYWKLGNHLVLFLLKNWSDKRLQKFLKYIFSKHMISKNCLTSLTATSGAFQRRKIIIKYPIS